ncbi:helix-turn-helix domain-containing protein [Candidatus Woesearchaeota archaeon]|nr:helix-turn-helix domain-containing protein [Candidatus Woesearchaeota archaeon]
MNTELLEEIGLTKSEIKVYLALLEIGSSSKGPLVKKANITSSKIYEVTDKLIEKGLVSYIIKNNVKYFSAAPPSRIKDYIEEKREKIEQQEKSFETLLPSLQNKFNFLKEETNAEIFQGWKGMHTVFQDILNTLNKGDTDYVLGANQGLNPEKTRRFFDVYIAKTYQKGIKIKVIFNENSRDYYKKSKAKKAHIEARFLQQTTPSEINIYNNKVAILIFSETPLAILINSKKIAASFKQYFDIMWSLSVK